MTDTSERPLSVGILCYPTFGGSGVVAVELAQGKMTLHLSAPATVPAPSTCC